jgi:hypothetical protein
MRDIRGDLQDRANLLAEQISTAHDQFERLIEQLKREHETRFNGLKFELDTVRIIIGIEDRRAGNSLSATSAQTQLSPPHQPRPQPAQTQPETLIRRVGAVSVR